MAKEVTYQIYPRSFSDSNNDGIGDLQGIIQKLDYLENLGITLIWLSQCTRRQWLTMDMIFQTIMVFLAILVQWQTSMNSLKKQKRNIKVILDLVVNHTSDEHAWFQDVLKILKVVSRLLYYKRRTRSTYKLAV